MDQSASAAPVSARPLLPRLVDRIIESRTLLVALETPRPEILLEQLRQAAVRDGRAIYHYVSGIGIGSLREPGVYVPGTRSAYDALRHIEASSHFGIYIFYPVSSLGLVVGSPALVRLRQMIHQPVGSANPKRIVLMDRYVGVAGWLGLEFSRIFDQPGRTQLRLRNGVWVE